MEAVLDDFVIGNPLEVKEKAWQHFKPCPPIYFAFDVHAQCRTPKRLFKFKVVYV
jgi:hypothetical protein